MALKRPADTSQARGFAGTPSCGHCSERRPEGVVQRLLGEIEIAEQANERREDSPRLRAVDSFRRRPRAFGRSSSHRRPARRRNRGLSSIIASMPPIITIRNSPDLRVRLPGAQNVNLDIRRGEIFALLVAQRRRQDDADQRRRGIVIPPRRRRRRWARHRHRLPCRARDDRSRAAGTDHRRLRVGVGAVSFSRGLFGKRANPATSNSG